MIWVVHPGSGIRILTFYPSRIQGSKRHRIPDPEHWMKIRIRDKNTGSAKVVEQNLMFSFCVRELTYHFVKSGHKHTAAIACECGRRFHGGTSGAYRYHR
jgi:hypothetical protein